MGCEVKIFRPVLTVLFALNFIISSVHGEPKPKPKVPCYFIFGDSLADNGNNNLLDTRAKVNFPPYGIDFPQGPTGRFTNGRNIADFIAEFLGFDNYIPPFATGRGLEILQGLNYASGASGILDESGQHTGDRFSFNMQLQFHKTTILRIAALLGNRKSKDHLRKCIYTVGMGNNDYINNYFLPSFYESSHQFTPDQYAALLIKHYSQQLMTLYTYGARKVGVFGVGELGCIPSELNTYGTNGTACVEMIGNAVTLFNDRLIRLIEVLNNKLIDANFIYISPNSNKNSSEAALPSSISLSWLPSSPDFVSLPLLCSLTNSAPPSLLANENQRTFARYTERTAFERPLTSGVAYAIRVLHSEREHFEKQQGWLRMDTPEQIPVHKDEYDSYDLEVLEPSPIQPIQEEHAPVIFAQYTVAHVVSINMLSVKMLYSPCDAGNYFVILGSPAEACEVDNFMVVHQDNMRDKMNFGSTDFIIAIVGNQLLYGGLWLEHALVL